MRRLGGREAAARYRARQQISPPCLAKSECESNTSPSESAPRFSDRRSGNTADAPEEWHRLGPRNAYWPISVVGGYNHQRTWLSTPDFFDFQQDATHKGQSQYILLMEASIKKASAKDPNAKTKTQGS